MTRRSREAVVLARRNRRLLLDHLFTRFPAVSEFSSVMVGSADTEGAGLFRVDDLLDSTVDRIHVVVVTDARPRVFPTHFDVAVPFWVSGALKARRFEHSVIGLP